MTPQDSVVSRDGASGNACRVAGGGTQVSTIRLLVWFREMLSHNLGKRIMFGTDQMRWPDAIGMAVEVMNR